MSALFAQQQALLQQQLHVLTRIESGLRYSLERLPKALAPSDLDNAEVLERLASINDRYTKLQDQLSAALRHAHAMIGERYRGFADVIDWAVRQDLIEQAEVWMEPRALRNHIHLLPSPKGRGSQALLPSPRGRGAGGEGTTLATNCTQPEPSPQPSPRGRGSQDSALTRHPFLQAGGSQTPAFCPLRS